MTPHPYLQHLIPDPTFGYLFPHRLTLAAFGVPNDYHLRKHYPRLVEGQHYLKIRGSDHVERLFYSLAGLLVLSDLVNTPQSQAFKQALIAQTQSKGAIVPSQPNSLYQPPVAPNFLYHPPRSTASHLYTEQIPPTFEEESFPVPPDLPSSKRPPDPLPAPPIPFPAAPPPSQPTLQETASLIFEAQRVATQQAQQTAQTLLEAQRLLTQQPPTEIQVNITLWKHLDSWLSRQDTWAMSLIVAAIVSLAGMGAYFFAQAARQTPIPQTSSQTWR